MDALALIEISANTFVLSNGRSFMDLMVVDHSLFEQICDFKNEHFHPGLSDVHCALHCETKLSWRSSSNDANDVESFVKNGIVLSKKILRDQSLLWKCYS